MNGSDVGKLDGPFPEREGTCPPDPFPLPTGWNVIDTVAVVRAATQARRWLPLTEDSKATHLKEPRTLITLQRRAVTQLRFLNERNELLSCLC